MGHCKTCKYRDKNGYCNSQKISEPGNLLREFSDEEKKDMLLYSYDEGGSFWVGELFGCVHYMAED